MICQSIVFAIAFSFLITDIKSMFNEHENVEKRLLALSLPGNEESDDDAKKEENFPEEENIPEEFPIDTLAQTNDDIKHILEIESSSESTNSKPRKEEIEKFFYNEEKLLKQVENFLNDFNPYEYRPPDNEIAYGLVHVAYLTFWISANFKICALLYSADSIYGNPKLSESCSYRFYQLAKAFNYFKKTIEYFFTTEKQYGRQYGNDDKVECVAKEVLTLSLDFVLGEDDLQTKAPDQYVDGLIRWSSIKDVMINRKAYKTVFPSFKKLFCNCKYDDEYFPDVDHNAINIDPENFYYNLYNFADDDLRNTSEDTYQELIRNYYCKFHVCNCGILKKYSGSSSSDDKTRVYDDTDVISSSFNSPEDISFYNKKVQKKNAEILQAAKEANPHRNEYMRAPSMFDIYNELRSSIDSKVDFERFDLLNDFYTMKIGKGNKLSYTKFTTWFLGSITDDVIPTWESVAEIEYETEENIFSLIHFIRKLDEEVSLKELLYEYLDEVP